MLRKKRNRFSARSILITGASSGLGEALAVLYADSGMTLHLLGRNEARLRHIAGVCSAAGARVFFACIDVRDRQAMAGWLLQQDALAPIDLVIANAGISAGTGGDEEDEAQARMIFSTNIDGVLNTVWPLLPALCGRRRGSICLLSSLAAMYPMPTAPAYSASKVAVRYYGEALRLQLAASGVNVVMVCPGFIDTPMTRVNPFPMPFLMRADEAARRIRDAIACGKPRVFFPSGLFLAVRALHLLPQKLVFSCFSRVPAKPHIS